MAYTGQHTPQTTDEQLGAFSGYVRRPTPNTAGMVAQIFGENGEDADTILALSLSKYQDAQVYVNMYLIKDSDGKIMKEGDKYPLICSFLGFVRRSNPKKEGMIAQFFAPNGSAADAVSELSKSNYQDCLVFVDVRGSLAVQKNEQLQSENIKEIDIHYLNKLTKQEKEDLNKKEKQFRKLNELLEMDFLSRIEVVTSLGNPDEFKEWVASTQTCAHAGNTCLNSTGALKINGLLKPFNYLPVCQLHTPELLDPVHFDENSLYYEMRHRYLLKKWAIQILNKRFASPSMTEADPERVIEWAATKNLVKFLPQKYKPVY